MRKSIFVMASSLFFLMTACQKETNLTTTSPSILPDKFDYAPMSEGSSFTYEFLSKDSATGAWKTSEMQTNVGSKEDFQKQKWTIINHSEGQSLRAEATNELNRCDGFVWTKLLKTYNNQGVSVKNYEIPMLKYPLTKGKTWKSEDFPILINNEKALVFTMFAVRETGLTRTVKDVVYRDVVRIDEEAAVEIRGIAETVPVSRFYDKKAGLIEAITFGENPITGREDTVSIQRLVRFDIK